MTNVLIVFADAEKKRVAGESVRKKFGHDIRVFEAQDYPQAMTWLSQIRPGLIICQLELGEHTALDVFREANDKWVRVALILWAEKNCWDVQVADEEQGAIVVLDVDELPEALETARLILDK